MPARHSGKVDKGWGYELIWATNDSYCGKILVFETPGSKMSMHFHKINLLTHHPAECRQFEIQCVVGFLAFSSTPIPRLYISPK